jgi:hypothetical protein
MGMDVVGASPSKKCGEYFRANVWWWSPLWEYCIEVAPEICEEVEHGFSNDGDGLDGEMSKKLATVLLKEIKAGNTKKYEDERKAELDALPDERCDYCAGTGERSWWTDETGENQRDIADGELTDEEKKIYKKTVSYKCNGCKGKGKKRPWATEYDFETEFVKEFATFLRYCGGFHIY